MGSELVERLTYLVSLDERRKGGPYGGVAASECMAAMREAATTLSAQEEQIERLREALAASDSLIVKAQGILSKHLQPHGGTDSEAVVQLLYLLDGPEQRAVQDQTRAALAKTVET